MNSHVDIPNRDQLNQLIAHREPSSISIVIRTAGSSQSDAPRIEMKNAIDTALDQLRADDADKDDIVALEASLGDLVDDAEFWRFQSTSLAVFATPTMLKTFRLPNNLHHAVVVSDRFFVKSLLRTVTFRQAALVLALAQGSVRLISVSPDAEPFDIKLSNMPSDAASAVGKSSISDRSPSGKIQGSEGQKVRIAQYARQVDQAMRPFLNGQSVPLIIAATQPTDAIFRSVCTYAHTAATSIDVNPETTSDIDLAARARTVLDGIYAADLATVRELYELRESQGRAVSDVADVARAATMGMVDTLMVDIDDVLLGTIDEETGMVSFETTPHATNYGVLDEITRRVWTHGGRVMALRSDDIPGGASAAAILRFSL
jgi:hypothetical protein